MRANSLQFNKYKKCLDNDSKYLVDLLLEIQAYDIGFTMQSWHDYQRENLEIGRAKGIKDFVEAEEDYYGRDKVQEVKENVNSYFRSSFNNKRSEKIRNLMYGRELMDIKPSDSSDSEGGDGQSLMDDLNKNWLPLHYKTKRLRAASGIKRRYKLSDNFQLVHLIFNKVIYLSNESSTTKNAKEIVSLFERGIEKILPMFMNDLGETGNSLTLLSLRRSIKARFNTLCWRCAKPLTKRKNDKHYCTRLENRKCYLERHKEARDPDLPQVILRTKNKCDRCGRQSSLNYIHKMDGRDAQFCSNKCWESYRKAEYRHKKTLLHTS